MNSSSSPLVRGMLITALVLCVGLAAVAVGALRRGRRAAVAAEQSAAELRQLQASSQAAAAKLQTDLTRSHQLLAAREKAYHELQDAAATAAATAAAPSAGLAAVAAGPGDPNHSAAGGPSWLDRLREENPQRYQQIQTEREQWRKQITEQFQQAMAKLDDRLQTAQSQDEADLVSQLAETMSQLDGLRDKWQTVRDLPDDQRREESAKLGAESMGLYQKLTDLRAKDRALQLTQLATQIGYQNPNQAAQFVTSVQQIIQETDTSLNRMLGLGRGGGFGRMMGGGGGGTGGGGTGGGN